MPPSPIDILLDTHRSARSPTTRYLPLALPHHLRRQHYHRVRPPLISSAWCRMALKISKNLLCFFGNLLQCCGDLVDELCELAVDDNALGLSQAILANAGGDLDQPTHLDERRQVE